MPPIRNTEKQAAKQMASAPSRGSPRQKTGTTTPKNLSSRKDIVVSDSISGKVLPTTHVPSQNTNFQKTKRQHERRYSGILLRPAVTDRVFSDSQKRFIVVSHRVHAEADDTRNQKIPLKELTRQFNYMYQEDPPRSQASIASLVQRDAQLGEVRRTYN